MASNKIKNLFISPVPLQLAKLENQMPRDNDWLWELKYDGYRVAAYAKGGNTRLITRNGNDCSGQFDEITKAVSALSQQKAMVLDGEVVVIDKKGKTNFNALQNYKGIKGTKLLYIVFDILALDGKDLRGEQLVIRKQILKELLKNAPININYSEHVKGALLHDFKAICSGGHEGLIGKKAQSVYSGTRNGDWIKLKCENRQEFVICGYTRTNKKISGVSALLLGFYNKSGSLVFAGRVGTGFTVKTSHELEQKFKNVKSNKIPFAKKPKIAGSETVVWLKPHFAAEVKFAQWTQDGLLRHPSFIGLRTDKEVKDIVKEQADDTDVNVTGEVAYAARKTAMPKLTNPNKVIFKDENITKQMLAQYYEKVAERMLPYVKNRFLSLICCPGGTEGGCFYKKHPEDDKKNFIVVSSAAEIIKQVQMNTIEFHTWASAANSPNKPDIMIFDLDPDENMGLGDVRRGVRDIKSVLDKLGLVSYLKTSGGKGYHAVVPFKKGANWQVFSNFAKGVAQLMEQKWPNRYTTNVRKVNRKGKIFVDYLRNTRGATSAAPYAVRARRGAPVSAPIEWSELNKIAPNGINMSMAIKRLSKKDPWQNFFETKLTQRL